MVEFLFKPTGGFNNQNLKIIRLEKKNSPRSRLEPETFQSWWVFAQVVVDVHVYSFKHL